MAISKLFVKVFGEDIFEKYNSNVEPDLTGETCATASKRQSNDITKLTDMTLSDQMTIIRDWLQDKLDTIEENSDAAIQLQRHDMKSRLGPHYIIFDIDFTSTVRVSADRLTIRSQGSFNTVKANACVYGGRWMYEVHLHSKGVMQLGWASNKCIFTDNSGVGDSKMSYGFDGSKQQKWHISTEKYGEKWQIGDILSITIDVDEGNISYYRNGIDMGIAFKKLEKGPGICFFPAVSLGFNQALRANFGNTPFRYPVAGYMPLQAKPIVQLQKTNLLMGYLINLATIISNKNCCRELKKQHLAKEEKFSTRKMVYVLFSTLLTEKLTTVLFDEYVIEDKLLLHIQNLTEHGLNSEKEISDVIPGSQKSVLGVLLSIFSNYFEWEEYKFLLKKLTNTLLAQYTITHKGLDYSIQLQALQILRSLCNHDRTRKCLLEYKFFKKHCLPLFMYIRPPEYDFMETLFPEYSQWNGGIEINGSKSTYFLIVNKLQKSTEKLYDAQKALLFLLMTNEDGDEGTPSSRYIFLTKLRRYAMDSSIEQRPFHTFFLMQSSIQHPIESTVSLSFVCILIDITRALFGKEKPAGTVAEVTPRLFYDGTLEYQHFDRVGGVLSHLRKVYRNEILQQLGPERTHLLLDEDRTVIRIGELDPNTFLATGINNIAFMSRNQGSVNTMFTHFFNPRTLSRIDLPQNNNSTENSLHELLDIAILHYYSVGHKYIVKIAATRDEIASLNDALMETRYYREDIERKWQAMEKSSQGQMSDSNNQTIAELRANFLQRQSVFMKRACELGRKQAWYRAVALGKHRKLLLIWLLEKNLSTLNSASKTGALFAFVPEVYINILPLLLDSVMDFCFHEMAYQFEITDAECAVNSAADFLGLHSADSRIVLASCKDSLLQALGTLTCHKDGIRALEKSRKISQLALVRALLRPYENRAWGQSNWLLLRFWMGDGFAYRESRLPSVWQGGNTPLQLGLCRSRARNEHHTGLLHHVAPQNPSKHFQKLIGEKLSEDETFSTAFLNSVLSQLNWAFSEFILLLQDIQNTAHRQETTIFEPKQLKICSMCFELTVSLMRCLEMIISVAPDIVHDSSRPNSDLLLTRISQLCSQVLSRITVPPGCFQFVVDMCSSDLNSVSHFPIITAALGILLALMRYELYSDKNPAKVTRITRALLTDPSFQFANLEFALGEVKTPILQQTEIPRGNFDPQTRAHIDPLTNDVRVPMPTTSTKRIRSDPPMIKFSLREFPTHVTAKEIEDVKNLINMLRITQALLSDITLPSEDSLCPICCAKPIAAIFLPCKHQSCSNCILQHLMNSKVCFYCKSMIKSIETADGETIYTNEEYVNPPLIENV